MIRDSKSAIETLQNGIRDLRQALEHAKSEKEKEDIKAQMAELSRNIFRFRKMYVLEIGVPILIVLVFILLGAYLIQRF